jgi:TetR/AcrR family transcriptional regulator, mexJK operon transcriptional repressor
LYCTRLRDASTGAIAEAAPVSKPTLYNHFKGKQELFVAVIASQCEALLNRLSNVQTEFNGPVVGLKAIAFVELVYQSGAEPVSRQLSTCLAKLQARSILQISDLDTSSQLFLNMLKGDQHLSCLLGLQSGLSDEEKQRLIDAAVSLFLKGHGHDA